MADWQLIVQSWLDQCAALLSKVPVGTAFAAILLPVVLAIFSKRVMVVLGCILLAVIAFSVFVAPSNTAVTLAAGVYFGSIILAVSGIVSRRKAKVHRAEFALLREDVKRLLDAEHRRILKKVTSSKKEAD